MKFNTPLIFILIVSLIFRLSYFKYPLIHTSKWGDGLRDYLVAHYILKFGEIPLIGPFNLLFDAGIKNSPLYYYLLSVFLIPYDSVMTLGAVNILFQIATIALIYLITEIIFDKRSAILASLLFAFTPQVLRQSEYIWQPYLMQPMALLSIYLLAQAYFKKSYKLILGSLVAISLSFTLHNSGFPYVLPILIISFLLLKYMGRKAKFYLGAILTLSLTLLTAHLPVLIYYMQNGISFSNIPFLKFLNNYFTNLSFNFAQLFQSFSLEGGLSFGLVLIMISYLVLEKTTRRFFLIGLILFFSPILLSSLFNKNQLHYLTLSLGVFPILVSASSRLFKNIFIWLILALVLFYTFSQQLTFLNPKKEHVESEAQILSAARSVQEEVLNIKLNENLSNFNFFQIISFANRDSNFRYPTLDTILVVPLEKSLSTKLAKISDDSAYNLMQTGSDKYIFLTCFEFDHPNLVYDCSNNFLTIYPDHTLIKNIYNQYPLSIYLTKRNEQN